MFALDKIEINWPIMIGITRATYKMECSICYNEITAATGKVELSCSHPFHFSCLTKWFDRQSTEGCGQNCPMCRHEANEFEKMPEPQEEEEEDDEDDSYEDEEPTLEELAAQERARILFDKLKSFNPIEEVQLYAANRIKACWRGYQDRLTYSELRGAKFDIDDAKKDLADALNRQKFLKSTIGLSRTQVKNMAATKIQSILRMHTMKTIMKAGPKQVTLPPGVWVEKSIGTWQRVVMNPEEDIPSNIQCHPLSTVS
jgi:hypothetical protein